VPFLKQIKAAARNEFFRDVAARKSIQHIGIKPKCLSKKSTLSDGPKKALDEKEQLKQLEFLLDEQISDSFSSDDENTFQIDSKKWQILDNILKLNALIYI